MARESSEPDRSGTTRAHRFELRLWYDEGARDDPSRWRFSLSDTHSNEQVGGIGVAGLTEAVALLTSRFEGRPTPVQPGAAKE
ncbi:MAG: hypothetical protein R3195_19500 [Gemmatimonadota bacterium]|nr:hypothetical protein [Gemmatimonadota bacterium]